MNNTIEDLAGAKLYEAVARLIKGSWLTKEQALKLMQLIAEHAGIGEKG